MQIPPRWLPAASEPHYSTARAGRQSPTPALLLDEPGSPASDALSPAGGTTRTDPNGEGPDALGSRRDGRRWDHEVKLEWAGYVDVDIEHRRFRRLVVLAKGQEHLTWGNAGLFETKEPDVAHLPAGHPIDLESGVRYGLLAEHSSARARN